MNKNKFGSIESENKQLKDSSRSNDNINVVKFETDKQSSNSSTNTQILDNVNINDYRLNHIRCCASFLAEFGFIIILIIIYLFLLLPTYHPSSKLLSKISSIPFDSDYNPKIFLHFSDIFLSQGLPRKLDSSLLFLKSFLEYKPDLILITGNVVDNYKGSSEKSSIKPGCQSPEDWKIYNISLKPELGKYPVIDIPGNHDVWGVDSVISKLNMFLDYSFIYNRTNVENDDDFTIRKVKILDKIFILFNDFRFPTPRPPYGNEPHTSKHQLDLLEDMIDNLEEEECYILTHYYVDRAWLIKSSKGHYFEEIISNKKVAGVFSGHSPYSKIKIFHHGKEGIIEYNSPSVYKEKNSGLITIDNDNLIYHNVYIPYPNNKTLYFLTYPVPNSQISNHHIFHLNKFDIRVISFAKDNNIKLKIKGDINGELQYIKTLKNGALLYSYPVELENGEYRITIYDEDNDSYDLITTSFTIGKEYLNKKELAMQNVKFLLGYRFLSIPFVVFIFIIVTPFIYEIKFKKLSKIESYINGNNFIEGNQFILHLWIILLGPFILRKNFQEIKLCLRIFIFICILYPLALPVHFFNKINGKIGFVFNVFVVIGSKTRYDHDALEITFLFYITVIYPFILLITGLKYSENNAILIVNNLFFFCLMAMALFINFTVIIESLSIGYLYFSTGYIICLYLLYILFIINLCSKN